MKPHYTPHALWGRSIAETLRKEGLTCYWEGKIRRSVSARVSGRREICGVSRKTAKARVPDVGDVPAWAACHEVWRYDLDKKTATIIRFELLCRRCNLATHIGKAMAWLNPEQMEAIVQHIARVNGTDAAGVRRLIQAAERSKDRMDAIKWKPLVGERLIAKYPALRLIRL